MNTPLIPLVVRIGFTGHRNLASTQASKLVDLVKRQIAEVQRESQRIAEAHPKIFMTEPRIEFLSGLAQGADLCAARAAHEAGCVLVALSPFRWAEFCKDFHGRPEEELAEAERLWSLAAPHRVEFLADVERDANDPSSAQESDPLGYAAVGRFLVGHSDLLIAYFDSVVSGGGAGGTEWVLERARNAGVARLVLTPEGDSLSVALETALESNTLQAILEHTVQPPANASCTTCAKASHGVGGVTHLVEDYLTASTDEGRSGLLSWCSTLFDRGVRLFAKENHGQDAETPPVTEPEPIPLPDALQADMRRADDLASYYNGLHRTGFALIYVLGFLAVLFAVLGHLSDMRHVAAEGHEPGISGWAVAEIITLVLIVGIFLCARRSRIREKGTDFRLLAELLRAASGLWPLRTRLQLPEARAHGSDGEVNETWMAWYARALTRRLGMQSATFDADYLGRCARHLRVEIVDSQITFHGQRIATYGRIERWINYTVTVLFSLAIFGCVDHLFHFGWVPSSSLILTAALPALGAALHGIATQSEFARLEQRYEAMESYFLGERERMNGLQGGSRDELLGFARRVSARMVDEVAEWRWLHADHDAHLP